MATVTLTCAFGGHPWQREVKRGRQPRFCPDHQPDGSTVVVCREPATRAIDGLLSAAYAALEKTGEQEEDVRKVLYCARQIESGRDDLSAIEACLKDIIRKAAR